MATGLDAVAVFVSVVEAGSFTKAALATGVPRSTVSARVAELEARLGVALLRRTTRRLQLTEAGRDYFDSVRQSLQQIAAAELALKSNQSEARGRLRIAAATNMGEGVIGDAIADFLAAYPHIEIELELGQRRVELIAEQYDLAIRLGELEETSSLVARRIGTIARQLMASPVYAADRAISHPRDINPREIIGFAGEQAIELLHEGGERYLLECRGRLQVNRMTAIRHTPSIKHDGQRRLRVGAGRQFPRDCRLADGRCPGPPAQPGRRGSRVSAILLFVYGLSLVGAGMFKADPGAGFPPGTPDAVTISAQGLMHLGFGGVGFLALIAAALIQAGVHFRSGDSGWGWFSAITGVGFFGAFVGIASGPGSPATVLGFYAAVILAFVWLSATFARVARSVGKGT